MKLSPASNRQKRLLRKLNRKKYRYKERLFLLEGERAIEQVVENGNISVKALFFDISQELWVRDDWQELTKRVESSSLETDLFREVTDTMNPQGVLALCRMPQEQELDMMAAGDGLIIALDALQDPGNLGTIVRTAAWFDCRGIISGKGTVGLFHPKVVRSTAGATGSVPYLTGDLEDVLPRFENAGWEVLLLDAGVHSLSLSKKKINPKTILVTGNEARGIRPALADENRTKVRIPAPKKQPDVESLNAAIATSIALYDLSGRKY
jgi:TrmH family RNA methyltransferase